MSLDHSNLRGSQQTNLDADSDLSSQLPGDKHIPTPAQNSASYMASFDRQAVATQARPLTTSKTRKWLGISILALVVLCFGTIATAAFLFISKGSDVAEPLAKTKHFYNAMIRHEYPQAHDDLARSLADSYTLQRLEDRWEALEGQTNNLTIASATAPIKTGQENSARVRVTLTGSGDTKRYEIWLEAQRVEGVWKITDATPELIPDP